MRLFLKLLPLAMAIALDHTASSQQATSTSLTQQHSALKHARHDHALQPSDLPEILDIYDREAIHALAAQPGLAQAYLTCASEDIRNGDYESAIRKVVNARVLDPAIPNASTIVAEALNGLRRYEDAYLLLRALRGPEALSWQAIYERARAEVGIGNLRGADLWSLRAVATAPSSFPRAHLVRGEALMIAERWQEARAELDLYIRSDADAGQHPEALEALNSISRLASNLPEPAAR